MVVCCSYRCSFFFWSTFNASIHAYQTNTIFSLLSISFSFVVFESDINQLRYEVTHVIS